MAIWFVHESQNVYNVECVDHSFGEKGKNVNWQKRHTKQQKKSPVHIRIKETFAIQILLMSTLWPGD